MDEFTSIAIWLLATYLVVSGVTVWFMNQPTFINNNLITGTNQDSTYNEENMLSIRNTFNLDSCSSVEANPLAYGFCFLGQIVNLFTDLVGNLWNLLTGWMTLFNWILTPLPGGSLFRDLLIPFFALIQFMAILVLSLRVGGIIRGGS
jgi:hypothetical protein